MQKAEKSDLRRILRAKRSAIPSSEKPTLARLAAENSQDLLKPHAKIGLYFATNEELDTRALAEQLWLDCKAVYLPVIHPSRKLSFRLWTQDTKLTLSRLKTYEPEPIGLELSAHELDALIIPLVGFDQSGARLGMGGGFYDTTLARTGTETETETETNANANAKAKAKAKLIKIGWAFDIQELSKVPTEAHDVILDYVVTPTRVIRSSSSAP